MGIKIECILCGEEMTKSHSLYGNISYCDASCKCGLRFEASYPMDELDSWQDAMEIVEQRVDRALHQPQPEKDEWDNLLDRVNEIVNKAAEDLDITLTDAEWEEFTNLIDTPSKSGPNLQRAMKSYKDLEDIEVTYGAKLETEDTDYYANTGAEPRTIYFSRIDNPLVYSEESHQGLYELQEVEVGDIIWDSKLGKSFTVTKTEDSGCLAEDLFKDTYELKILNSELIAKKKMRKTPLYL